MSSTSYKILISLWKPESSMRPIAAYIKSKSVVLSLYKKYSYKIQVGKLGPRTGAILIWK